MGAGALAQQGLSSNTKAYPRLYTSSESRKIDSTARWEDLAARIDLTPPDAKIRGMFLREAIRLGGRAAANERNYVPFSLYPVRDYMALLLRIAIAKSPSKSAANALLDLGLGVYPLFASSMTGVAIFAVAHVDFRRVCELCPKAYNVTLKPASATTVHATNSEAIVQLRKVWIFPEIFHAGIWIGAMHTTKVKGSIEITQHSPCDVDLHMRWTPE
jgi:uncharacterized protein (TIGR02265 family)